MIYVFALLILYLATNLLTAVIAGSLIAGWHIYRQQLKHKISSPLEKDKKDLQESRDKYKKYSESLEKELLAYKRGLDLPIYSDEKLREELWSRAINSDDETSYFILQELFSENIEELNSEVHKRRKIRQNYGKQLQ